MTVTAEPKENVSDALMHRIKVRAHIRAILLRAVRQVSEAEKR
jgi:hypothetical protein